MRSLQGIEVVIADPDSFKEEKKKVSTKIEARVKSAKTPGDINRASVLVAEGVFDNEHVLMERSKLMIDRVVISTEIPHDISQDLTFFVMGYNEGVQDGVANTVP